MCAEFKFSFFFAFSGRKPKKGKGKGNQDDVGVGPEDSSAKMEIEGALKRAKQDSAPARVDPKPLQSDEVRTIN